ncbi:MAG: hypothetical protein NZ585_03620 [Chloracidobacterium sp.]|nr:hypothetical protein [Chloracidobacterium sp.]MDW8217167.1 hypothetical protein [Acidobacteriota bacterium]
MTRAAMTRAVRRRDGLRLFSLVVALGLGLFSLRAEPVIPRNGVRWHYERALVFDAQDQIGRALAALHRALDAAEERRRELQRIVKATLPADKRAALEALERTAYDRRLVGSADQRQAQQVLAAEWERLAAERLASSDLAEWHALLLRTAECRYLMAQLYWRNDRAADAILVLTQVVDAPGLPDYVPARLLLARAYNRLGAWERALPHLERLAEAIGLSDPEARQALKLLKTARTQRTPPPNHAKAREALQTLTTAVENACLAKPTTYRDLTLGRGLKDPVAYLELAHLFAEDEEQRDEVRAVLLEGIRVRNDFFPVAWLALGDEAETRAAELEAAGKRSEAVQAYRFAAEAFETAFRQLEQLDFQPERDFDPARLTALRRKIAALCE